VTPSAQWTCLIPRAVSKVVVISTATEAPFSYYVVVYSANFLSVVFVCACVCVLCGELCGVVFECVVHGVCSVW